MKYENYMNVFVFKFSKTLFTCEPALNAMNPNIKIKAPREIKGMEWPEMYLLLSSLKRSILGPRIIAPKMNNELLLYKCEDTQIYKRGLW